MNYRDTRIYQCATELLNATHGIIEALPPGYAFLADQLRRAASSIVLNFAEGCGKNSPADRRRYFHNARGSAYEVAAAVDVALAFGAITAAERDNVAELCEHTCAMLTRFAACNPRRR